MISNATGIRDVGTELLRLASLALVGTGYEELGKGLTEASISVIASARSGKRIRPDWWR
jgi:hypothetical protein